MRHNSTWPGGTRATRWAQRAASVGLLLACVLLAGFASTALASTTEMAGEWSIVLKSGSNEIQGIAIVAQEPNGQGEFASASATFNIFGPVPGAFSGTLEGSDEVAIKVTLTATGPVPASEFNGTKIQVQSAGGVTSLSGSGTFVVGGSPSSGTISATKTKTLKEVQEREKREKEEKEARANVRGEWALTLEAGPETLKGVAFITEEANVKNEFGADNALFESVIPGTFSGTLKGSEASVTVTTQATGPYPEGKFTSTTIAVSSPSDPTSMSGSGTYTVEKETLAGTFKATRLKTYKEVQQQREEQEIKEEEAQEAKEKQEKEAQEAAEKATREQKERELKAQKERQELEMRELAAKVAGLAPAPLPTPLKVVLDTTTFTVGHNGAVSLKLSNPNGSPVSGHLKLTLAKAPKASKTKHKGAASASGTIGEASFSLSSDGTVIVKVKLSSSGRAELTRRKTLHVLVTLIPQGDPQSSYNLTLHAAKPSRSKH